jgi:hypothetical protein
MNPLEERDRILKEIIKPALKQAGFKTSGNNFMKEEDGFIKVFSLENISWNTQDNVSFSLLIGITFPIIEKIRNRKISKFPSSSSSHFCITTNQLNKSQRLFDINPDTDIAEFRKYTSEVINNYVIPFFDKYSKIENCIELCTLYESYRYDIKPFIGLTLIAKGDIGTGNKLMENINPTYIESFKKQMLDHRDYLISKQK